MSIGWRVSCFKVRFYSEGVINRWIRDLVGIYLHSKWSHWRNFYIVLSITAWFARMSPNVGRWIMDYFRWEKILKCIVMSRESVAEFRPHQQFNRQHQYCAKFTLYWRKNLWQNLDRPNRSSNASIQVLISCRRGFQPHTIRLVEPAWNHHSVKGWWPELIVWKSCHRIDAFVREIIKAILWAQRFAFLKNIS